MLYAEFTRESSCDFRRKRQRDYCDQTYDTAVTNGKAYIALYNGNGILQAVKIVDVDMRAYLLYTSVAVEVNLPIPEDADHTWYTKAFLWSGDNTMQPLAKEYIKQ